MEGLLSTGPTPSSSQLQECLTLSSRHSGDRPSQLWPSPGYTGMSLIPGHHDEDTMTSGLGYHNNDTKLGYQDTKCGYHYAITARPRCLGVFGNIAFPSTRNNGKPLSPPFTEEEWWFPPYKNSHTVQSLLQTSSIKLIFGEVRDKCAIFIWV